MTKRQFFAGIFLSAMLGAVVALTGYHYFFYKQPPYQSIEEKQRVRFSNYLPDTAVAVPAGLNFIYAANMVRPGVVHIKTMYTDGESEAMDEVFREFHGFERGSGVRESAGSGVIISSDGYIVTNNHVIENASRVQVVLEDKRSYEAKVIGTDPTTDLALLKIEENNLSFVRYGNFDMTKVGEWVLAIGNPFDLTSTVTAGIISGKGRDIHILKNQDGLQVESFIQTDAAVNPGNSGGALVNLKGELIGINTAIATTTGSYAGYSFAVPVTLVKKVMEDLLKYGEVQRGLLGIQIDEVTAELAEEKGLKKPRGVYIIGVTQGEAADKAGIRPGDVITRINNMEVNTIAELQGMVATYRPGDKLQVVCERKGKELSLLVILRNRRGGTSVVKREPKVTTKILGAELEAVGKEELALLGITGGVKILRVGEGSIRNAGIREGFIITKLTISGSSEPQSVENPEEIKHLIEHSKVPIWVEGINPDGVKGYYAVNP